MSNLEQLYSSFPWSSNHTPANPTTSPFTSKSSFALPTSPDTWTADLLALAVVLLAAVIFIADNNARIRSSRASKLREVEAERPAYAFDCAAAPKKSSAPTGQWSLREGLAAGVVLSLRG